MVGVSFQPLISYGAAARTFSFIGSCTSIGSSLDFSALSAGAIAAGDLAVYIDYSGPNGAGAPSTVLPSGFASASDASINSPQGFRGTISTKTLAGSEGVISGLNQANNNKIGLVFRPSSAFSSIAVGGSSAVIVSTNPTSQVCDPSAETTAVILITVCGAEGSTAAFSTRSPAADGSVSTSDSDLLASYNVYNTSPQSVTADMNDLGDVNYLASLYLTVS